MRSLLAVCLFATLVPAARSADAKERHFLYVVTPGIRDLLEYGGAGILVFDMDDDYKFVKRIATPASQAAKPDNIKGVVANASTGRLYFTTRSRLYCIDLVSQKPIWDKSLEGGTDRPALTANGKSLFVPSFEGPHWNVVEGDKGEVLKKIIRNSGAHNTCCNLDGSRVFLAGLRSPILAVVDTKTNEVVQEVGPFSNSIRPFTVNGAGTLCFVNLNGLLGFEVGDVKTGKMLHRVEVPGVKQGPVKRHGCPSHGIGLTPDEKEIWVVDAHNQQVHVYDATVMPPKYQTSIKLCDEPGWITFSLDGRHAYPSTGEIIDVKSRKIITALKDEEGRRVMSEKMVELVFRDGKPVRNGDQFGIGRVAK